ncbi:TonB-dependent receptor [Mucilaginibacter limnophilus]|uniref:TonB-dependent receptor n=1 Tax=Mucilaginibacter limnophilus TaxID=1932778 RepID=A0A3S2WYC4_9SPHI|nr:TonB-dependent receptor [Mucilaginibacter limnophilus]RVU00980.1 TonB-dependent receptor [Mucilaginibacter limnophilus]
MRKLIRLVQIVIFFIPIVAYSQQAAVTGVVKDASGSLPGVTVIEKGLPTNGVSTDAEGKFKIILKGNSNVLVFRAVGYVTREIKVANTTSSIEVKLQTSAQGLDEVVVVGYGTRTRITNTGAVSTISADKIRNIPTSSVQNTLAGRVPGFFSQQRSGQPGKDASDFFIRGVSSLNADGNRPLIVVDDIEYTYEQLSQINVNEIENISILKDASTTAIYGIKGANGVLVVRTRRGTIGDPKVTIRVETGLQTPIKKPVFLDSYNTAVLRNEALSNDGFPAQFSQNDLDLFKSGADEFGHPDVNWYNEIFKPRASQSNANIDISGGTPRAKYFISGGAFTQDGAVKDFATERSEVNSNYFYKRYNFRTNLDLQATKTLTFRVDLTGRFGEINEPYAASNLLGEIYNYERTTPYGAPFLNPNGSYAYNRYSTNYLPTINSRLATQGYNRTRRTDFNILLEANQKLDVITSGLSAKVRVSYASTSDIYRGLTRETNIPVYLYTPATGSRAESYVRPPGGPFVLSQFFLRAGNSNSYKSVNLQGFINYDRTFGKNHVYSLLLYNRNSQNNKSDLPTNYLGYSGRVGYEFDQKYLFDVNVAYNGSDRFAKHFGLFPAVSTGWNISREKFFKNNIKFVSLLKIRGSYGLVGSDATPGNKYLYQQTYSRGGSYKFGESSVDFVGILEGALGNSFVTWEKQRQMDIGIDLNAFNDKITLTADYFRNVRYDQLVDRKSVSEALGVGLPKENLGKVLNRGFDGTITYNGAIHAVQYNVGVVFSYAKNKILYFDEPAPDYPRLLETGRPLGQPFGYTWIGFYKDEADVANSPKPATGQAKPGDLKYADLNGDNIIDQKDKGAIGKPNLQNLTFGLPIGVHYKGFDANILIQGSLNYSLILTNQAIEPFQSQLQPIHQQRWTPQTSDIAQFPRLTTIRNTINSPSAYPSDFWLIDAQFIRLKTVELSYSLPEKLLPFKIDNARIYLSGYNLLTWTNYSLYQQDPEVASNSVGDSYLNQRVVNLGVQLGF